MYCIKNLVAREILDSRGFPTIEADVVLASGATGRAAVPSGASTGQHEALELRDGDAKRYAGKGVLKACRHIEETIAPALLGVELESLQALDDRLCELDGTSNKQNLGANATLAVSMAFSKAIADDSGEPLYQSLRSSDDFFLPTPLMNVINGGAHANNPLDIQEFMIVPVGAHTFAKALQCGAEIFHTLAKILQSHGLSTAVGDEGGFAPKFGDSEKALDALLQAIEVSGFRPGEDVMLALDVASSEFYSDGIYHLEGAGLQLEADGLVDYLANLCGKYPIISIEDGMAENDEAGWQVLTARLGDDVQLVGDDLFVTNTTLLAQGIEKKLANAILFKPNQIGTLSETKAAIDMAKQADYATIMSHRSGETEDSTIADLAVAWQTGQIKTGSLSRSDRMAKYNQLLRIESQLADKARFAGRKFFK